MKSKKKLVFRRVTKDIYGVIKIDTITYDLDNIAKIEYGKMKDFYNEADITGNGMEEDESCIIITLTTMDDGIPQKATFGSGWQITFE